MYSARNVTVSIKARRLVDGVSIDVRPGEVTAIVGANGAGKSTLLKSMSGDVRTTRGSVELDGRPIGEWSSNEVARRRGVLPQHSALSFALTSFEVAMLGRHPHLLGNESADDERIVREALECLDVTHLAGQPYPTLSGGERQRVHLARVLSQIWEDVGSPRYLLLDEPTSGLDLLHQHMTLGVVRSFSERNTGVLIVLHDLLLASLYCDKIYMMKNGRLFLQGKPESVLTADSISEVFDLPESNYRLPIQLMLRQIESVLEARAVTTHGVRKLI